MVAQVTIYLPDKLAKAAKRQARSARKSVSAWIAELLERELGLGPQQWPQDFIDLLTHGGADIEEPEDPPAEDDEPGFE
jgi:hypothetical protein